MPRFVVAALPSLAVLVAEGDDRIVWLQGQISNDVHRGGTVHAFRLDSHGKIEAEIHAKDDGSRIHLVVDADRADALATSLDRRIVMEDVAIARAPGLAVVGAYGDDPIDPATVAARFVTTRRFGRDGIEWLVDASEVASVTASIAAVLGASVVDEAALEIERIAHGMPKLGVDFDGSLPQETGLANATVSFVKGCYVGQEPVVMLEHRGKPPRRMMHLRGPARLVAPFDLCRADGTVVGRCASYGNGMGLGLVKRSDALPGTELFVSGAAVTLVDFVVVDPAASASSR